MIITFADSSFYLEILSRPNVLPSQVYLRDSGTFSIAKVNLGLFSSLGLLKSVSIIGFLIPGTHMLLSGKC